ncbi:hypothetical protein PROFUN_16183, partial [Planoprotostelium fungivorum]
MPMGGDTSSHIPSGKISVESPAHLSSISHRAPSEYVKNLAKRSLVNCRTLSEHDENLANPRHVNAFEGRYKPREATPCRMKNVSIAPHEYHEAMPRGME